jgi:hypothetical protein
MKRLLLTLIGALLLFGLQANALEQMKSLEAEGVRNADLYYNLGVGYWQTGQSGMANLYFLKALNLDSAHKSASENLEYVTGVSQDKDIYPQRLFLVRVFFRAYDFMTLNRMAIMSLILLLLCALSAHWLLHYDPEKERALPTLITGIFFVLFLISAIFLTVKAYRQAFNAKAVVISAKADLRSAADTEASRVAVIHEALILIIEKETEGWCLVRLPDGNEGWLPEADLMRVRD